MRLGRLEIDSGELAKGLAWLDSNSAGPPYAATFGDMQLRMAGRGDLLVVSARVEGQAFVGMLRRVDVEAELDAAEV